MVRSLIVKGQDLSFDFLNTEPPPLDLAARDREYSTEYREWFASLSPDERAKLKDDGLDQPHLDNYTTTDRVSFNDQLATISADSSVGYSKNDSTIVLREIWEAEKPLILIPGCLKELGSPLYRLFPQSSLSHQIIEGFRENATHELCIVLQSVLEAIQEDVKPAAALAVMLKAYGDEDLAGMSDAAIGLIVGESKSNINQVRKRLSHRLGIEILAGKSPEMKEKHRISNQPKFKN